MVEISLFTQARGASDFASIGIEALPSATGAMALSTGLSSAFGAFPSILPYEMRRRRHHLCHTIPTSCCISRCKGFRSGPLSHT